MAVCILRQVRREVITRRPLLEFNQFFPQLLTHCGQSGHQRPWSAFAQTKGFWIPEHPSQVSIYLLDSVDERFRSHVFLMLRDKLASRLCRGSHLNGITNTTGAGAGPRAPRCKHRPIHSCRRINRRLAVLARQGGEQVR